MFQVFLLQGAMMSSIGTHPLRETLMAWSCRRRIVNCFPFLKSFLPYSERMEEMCANLPRLAILGNSSAAALARLCPRVSSSLSISQTDCDGEIDLSGAGLLECNRTRLDDVLSGIATLLPWPDAGAGRRVATKVATLEGGRTELTTGPGLDRRPCAGRP